MFWRIKYWLHVMRMRRVAGQCAVCTPFCRHLEKCLSDKLCYQEITFRENEV